MKHTICVTVLLLAALSTASAQVASHATTMAPQQPAPATLTPATQVTGKTVVRVNGVALTDKDLVHEMYAIFPYARQHKGFPKSEEAEIRKGALDMIIFEELVYQEAERRKMVVPQATLDKAADDLRKGFQTPDAYQKFLDKECQGSRKVLVKKIRRSILIEELLQLEVKNKAVVTSAQVKSYYDQNTKNFQYTEYFNLQTISLLPPAKANADQLASLRKRAEDALRKAKATKTYEQFGMLAEKISEDDFRVNMGDHKNVNRDQLPPPVAQAALAMKEGQVSDLIQVEQAYTIVRLNVHKLAGTKTFADVKDALQKDLQKKKTNQLRGDLDKKLRKAANVELL